MKNKVKNASSRVFNSLLLTLVVYVFFVVASGFQFGSGKVLLSVARQTVQPCLMAYALYLSMSLGMWDFGTGAELILSAIIGGQLTLKLGLGAGGLVLFCLLICIALNLISILIQHFMKLPSIIVTLGLALIIETIGCVIYDGKGVNLISIRSQTVLGKSPYCFIILGIAALIFIVVYNRMEIGYHIRALGNGGELATNLGVSELKVKMEAAFVGGIFLGLSAAVYACVQNSAAPKSGLESVNFVFDVLMSVLIAYHIMKYCNAAIALIIGVFTMKLLVAGLIAVGLNATLQNVATGLFVLIFMGITNNQDRIYEKRRLRRRAEIAKQHRLNAVKEETT